MNKHFKTYIYIFGAGLVACDFGFAQADKDQKSLKPLTFSQTADLLVEKYQSKDVEQYENFNDKFIVMRHLNFPNIDLTQHKNKFSRADFDSPRALAGYKKEMKSIQRDDSSLNAFKKREFDSENYAQKRAERSKFEKQMYREVNEFTKSGYYGYFSKQLEEGVSRVSVCVNLDLDRLGLIGAESAATPYREKKKLIKTKINEVLASLDENSYETKDLDVPAGNFACDVSLEVDETALEALYNNKLVGSFIKPEIVRSSRSVFRTH